MMKTETEQLFLSNMGLAYYVLKKYYPTFSKDEDLQQEALLGLWKACLTYDESKSCFSTYASCCILNKLKRTFRNYARQPKAVSLSNPIGETDLTLGDIIEDPAPLTEEGFMSLKLFLEGLPEKERDLIRFSFEGLTQKEAGELIGRSRAWCCSTLKKLRKDYQEQED